MLVVLGRIAMAPCHAAIQAWEDDSGMHLSNLDTHANATVSIDDPQPPLIGLRDPAAPPTSGSAGRGGRAGAIGRPDGNLSPGPDLSRLVAHDPRTAERLLHFAPLVSQQATLMGMDAALVQAVVAIESAYNPRARSRAGAIGLMQVMPATAARYGIQNLEDPLQNLRAGCLYLKDLLVLFHENVDLALAAYNAGEHAVQRYGNQIPPFPETQRYVPQVVEIYHGLLQ